MKLVSWNVNGIRAVMGKGFAESLNIMVPDILCLQETKAQDDQVAEALSPIEGYHLFSNSALQKGYSGTAILSKSEPLSVTKGIGIDEHDGEGRVICAEYAGFYLVNVYTPNSGSELARLDYRTRWDAVFLDYLKKLANKNPLIVCGDFNVAHRPVDIARPDANYNKSAGYMQLEIDGMDNYHRAGFVDSFRHLHPDEVKYSWWSYRAGARQKNIGWRIDYFLVSEALSGGITTAAILNEIEGSDHCPVVLEMKI